MYTLSRWMHLRFGLQWPREAASMPPPVERSNVIPLRPGLHGPQQSKADAMRIGIEVHDDGFQYINPLAPKAGK